MILNTTNGKQYEAHVLASKPLVRATSIELDYNDVLQLIEMRNPTNLQFILEAIFMRLVPKGLDDH